MDWGRKVLLKKKKKQCALFFFVSSYQKSCNNLDPHKSGQSGRVCWQIGRTRFYTPVGGDFYKYCKYTPDVLLLNRVDLLLKSPKLI